jgi:predicted small metal-binding protein
MLSRPVLRHRNPSRGASIQMTRKIADCREMPSESGCTLTISGEEDEVLTAATQHAVATHGHEDTSELRDMIRQGLKDEISV